MRGVCGVCITAGAEGLGAAIVKIDDAGLWLVRKSEGRSRLVGKLGLGLVDAMPYLMRFLTVAGTVAMFMVGGGILAHGIPALEVRIESLSGLFLPGVRGALLHIGVGLIFGAALLGLVSLLKRLLHKIRPPKAAA